jgi:membrane fusion protein, multidrug efflux system
MSEQSPLGETRQTRLNRRLLLLVGVPTIAVIGAAIVYAMGGRYVSTDNAYVAAQKTIVTPSVAGRVISIAVIEGQRVKPGDPLFMIDPGSYELAVKQAEAHLAQTVTAFESLGISLKSLDRQIELAKETLNLRQADADRKADLLATKATSKNDVDSASIALATARNVLEALLAQRETILAQLQGKPDLSLEDYAPYDEAKAARDRALRDLDSTTVRASLDGVATQVSSIPLGRYLMPGTPVLALVADKNPWIIANPKETDLTYVREGQPVSITVDAFPGREWHGKVASLSPGTGAEFAVLPAQNASGNWVKVIQRVPVRIEFTEAGDLSLLRTGMSAQVEIDSGHVRSLASMLPFTSTAHAAGP